MMFQHFRTSWLHGFDFSANPGTKCSLVMIGMGSTFYSLFQVARGLCFPESSGEKKKKTPVLSMSPTDQMDVGTLEDAAGGAAEGAVGSLSILLNALDAAGGAGGLSWHSSTSSGSSGC